MSDLISRSKAVQRLIQETVDSKNNLIHINTIKRLLQDVESAYSVDEVVEELKQQAEQYRHRAFEVEKKGLSALADKYYGKQCSYEHAIEIVKQGGVSDDVCEWRLCDEEANVYDTSCRNPHILIEGTPKENNYEYCPYCGKKIKVVE